MRLSGNIPQGSLQELTWEQARSSLLKLDEKLVEAIDKLSPSDKYTLFKIKYSFGSSIVRNGEFHLPNPKGEISSLNDPSIAKQIREKLCYNFDANPVGILMSKSAELFINLGDRIVPFAMIPPGSIFGLWKILDADVSHCPPTFLWDMTAGARSLFMLPKISKSVNHQKLKHDYNIRADKPKNLLEHHAVFTEVANFEGLDDRWELEMMFFSAPWFDKSHRDDPEWADLYHHFLRKAWHSTEFWRNKFIWDVAYTWFRNRRNLKPSSYVTDVVKHLFNIGLGVLPGHSPAVDNSAAPIDLLQKVYLDSYRLTDYAPIIMCPTHFNMRESASSVYYSLQLPTAMELSQKSNDRVSAIDHLYAIKSLLGNYLREVSGQNFGIASTHMCQLPKRVKFEIYHASIQDKQYQDMRNSSAIAGDDQVIARLLHQFKNNTAFPASSSFFQGCIALSRNVSK